MLLQQEHLYSHCNSSRHSPVSPPSNCHVGLCRSECHTSVPHASNSRTNSPSLAMLCIPQTPMSSCGGCRKDASDDEHTHTLSLPFSPALIHTLPFSFFHTHTHSPSPLLSFSLLLSFSPFLVHTLPFLIPSMSIHDFNQSYVQRARARCCGGESGPTCYCCLSLPWLLASASSSSNSFCTSPTSAAHASRYSANAKERVCAQGHVGGGTNRNNAHGLVALPQSRPFASRMPS